MAKAQGAFNDENTVAMKSAKRSGVSRQYNRIKNATGQAQVERESLTLDYASSDLSTDLHANIVLRNQID